MRDGPSENGADSSLGGDYLATIEMVSGLHSLLVWKKTPTASAA
jgi:hypothetical protein